MTTRRERMQAITKDVWFLERNLVSDGYDRALDRFAKDLPLTVHRYPSGTPAWTWTIPEKWTCLEAYVERMNGERVLDVKNHPLHCASYSSSFEGVLTREELFRKLVTHPKIRDAIPFAWKYYKKDWALCCTAEQKAQMTDDKYKVVIRTRHEKGEMKVGEVLVPGETGKEIVLCAHLCHPCMMNDDLSGVLVGLEVMRELLSRPKPRYTYRLLLTPETIGSVGWLSRNEDKIPNIAGGLFLEMLGTDCPHSLQLAFEGRSELDACFSRAIKEVDPQAWVGPYRTVIGNDERQFNAPGVRVPMLSLSRVYHPDTGKWPYPEYHTDKDSPKSISWDRLEESVDAVLRLIETLENNRYPVNLFRGELFASRYEGLFTDFYRDQEGHRFLFDVIQQVDGTRTVNQIAEACRMTFPQVMTTLKKLEGHGLIRFSDKPV